MDVINFDKTVTVDIVNDWTGLITTEWYKGSGVYEIEIGSRGEIESVVFYGKVSGVVTDVLDVQQHLCEEDNMEDEFSYISKEDNGLVEVCVTDEHSYLYFDVV